VSPLPRAQAVKASPTGGLRPALTAFVQLLAILTPCCARAIPMHVDETATASGYEARRAVTCDLLAESVRLIRLLRPHLKPGRWISTKRPAPSAPASIQTVCVRTFFTRIKDQVLKATWLESTVSTPKSPPPCWSPQATAQAGRATRPPWPNRGRAQEVTPRRPACDRPQPGGDRQAIPDLHTVIMILLRRHQPTCDYLQRPSPRR
jgi:hypothetical protein